MKAVLQRVLNAKLNVDGEKISQIDKGLVVFLGIEKRDTDELCQKICKKIANIRIFEDENGKMNLSLKDINGQILLVSQFTLLADCSHGNRPNFLNAEIPTIAKPLYEKTIENLKIEGVDVKTGIFGADMKIEQVNDGPVTIILDNSIF